MAKLKDNYAGDSPRMHGDTITYEPVDPFRVEIQNLRDEIMYHESMMADLKHDLEKIEEEQRSSVILDELSKKKKEALEDNDTSDEYRELWGDRREQPCL